MTEYTLKYFNARGRAEVTRLIFAQAGIKYKDERVEFGTEEWAKLKPTTPTGLLPVLEVDGKMYPGSVPIARFVAERFGLAGTNDLENLQLAGIADTIADCRFKMGQFHFEKDETRKAELLKELTETHIPKLLGNLERLASANNSAGGWLCGPKVTYADFAFLEVSGYVFKVAPNLLDKYPALKKLKTSIENLPNIAKWLKERPESDL